MTVRAVVFDYFGTLTPTVLFIAAPEEQAAIGAALGVDPAELERLWHDSYDERATGRTGDLVATLRLLAGQLGARPTEAALAEAARIRQAAYLRTARPRPDAHTVLESLRAKDLGLAVISDCSTELVTAWPDLPLADAVDTTVFSAEVGRRKPDPALYQLACARLDVIPADCVYVGDGGSNELTGATAVGMHAVLLADAEWASGQRYGGEDWSGTTIHHLADVLDLVNQAVN